MLSVLGGVKGWFGENEPVLLWLTPQVRVDRLVPELLNAVPVLDQTTLEDLAESVGLLVSPGLLSNVVVEIWVVKLVSLEVLQEQRSVIEVENLPFPRWLRWQRE